MSKIKVLFVCMGNICRSPTAEAVFRHAVSAAGLQQQIQCDSAGTHGYHIGDPPDDRSQRHAARRGQARLRERNVPHQRVQLLTRPAAETVLALLALLGVLLVKAKWRASWTTGARI